MSKALLLTEETAEIFAEHTNYTKERLLNVLEQNAGLRYVLVVGLDPKKHWNSWAFMDDHYFRSLWEPESEVNGDGFVKVTLREQSKGK